MTIFNQIYRLFKEKKLYYLFSTVLVQSQEDKQLSRHDWKIANWEVKQHNTNKGAAVV